MGQLKSMIIVLLMLTSALAGCAGTDGADGTPGPQGPPGIQGETGPAGADGKDGADGTNGIDGINGTNGIDGINGTNGIDGINGTNGIDGIVEFYNGTNGITIEFSNIEVNLSSGWHTIAYLPSSSNQGHATFYIDVQRSGSRESIVFTAASHFSRGNSIVLHSLSSYGGLMIDGIRIMNGGLYDGAALQIHIDELYASLNTPEYIRWSMSNEVANSVFPHFGWKLLNNSIPDWGNSAVNISIPLQNHNYFTPAVLVDLDILCAMMSDINGVSSGCNFDIMEIINHLQNEIEERQMEILRLENKSQIRHNMSFIDLSNTNLDFTNLMNADLRGSNLNNSSLRYANLNLAWMHGAQLYSVNLTGASLYGAILEDVNLSGADLVDADLTGADLTGVNWHDTTCPDGTNSDDNGNTCENNL